MSFRSSLLALVLLASPAAAQPVWGSFDASRVSYANAVFSTNPQFSDLRGKITAGGGTVAPATATLTPAYLSQIDVFITSSLEATTGVLSGAEQSALVTWVSGGGTLVVTAEYQQIGANDSFLVPFGVSTSPVLAAQTATPTAAHPLTAGVTGLIAGGWTRLTVSGSGSVLMAMPDSSPFLAVVDTGPTVGTGRVIALGDHFPVLNQATDGAQFRQNLADWSSVLPTCPNDVATWSNYGAGWPGTNGVPDISLGGPPELNGPITFQVDNSRGSKTTALLVMGKTPAVFPSAFGGDLLLFPSWQALFSLPANGLKVTEPLPPDQSFCGVNLYVQVLQLDPGASAGLSFTPGMHITFGS